MSHSLLSRFGFSDGMRTGSTMANNIIVTSLIAGAAGFNESSLILFSGLSSFFGFLLEVPLAYLADERGWRKAVRNSFLLDFVILIFLMIAVWAGSVEKSLVFYTAMILRSLSIAFANGFERGAYQAAYLKWFDQKQSESESKKSSKLFIDSFRYSVPYRIFIPVLSCLAFFTLQKYFSVLLSSIICLSILGLSKLAGPWRDLDLSQVKNDTPEPTQKLPFYSVFMSSQSTFPDLTIYAYAWLVRNFIHAVLIAKSYHLFRDLGFSMETIFAGGSVMALTINFLNLFVSGLFFESLRKWTKIDKIRFIGSAVILILSFMSTLVFLLSDQIILQLCVLFIFCLTSLTFSDAVRFEIESDVKNISKNGYLASWLSAGNLLQYLAYAFIASIASYLGGNASLVIIFSAFTLIGLGVVFLKKKVSLSTLSVQSRI